jgi:Glycosyltransferase
MVRSADLLVCDSKKIEEYIREDYRRYSPRTTYLAYGCDSLPSCLSDDSEQFCGWLKEKGLLAGEYYLVVGRFVPENNVETIIREFMKSCTSKKLALITTENEKLYGELEKKLGFSRDKRICFTGSVYDQELLKKIRENAFAYLHGHSVGGTNPSLLEALGSTKLNLLLDVGFNREAGEDAALYWTCEPGSLSGLIETADRMSAAEIDAYGLSAKKRIKDAYRWESIVNQYEDLFKKESAALGKV